MFIENALLFDHQEDLIKNVNIKRFIEKCVKTTLHQQFQ